MVSLMYSLMALTCALVLLVFLHQLKVSLDRGDRVDRAYLRLVRFTVFFCIHDALWGALGCGATCFPHLFFVSSSVFHASAAVVAFLLLDFVLLFLRIENLWRGVFKYAALFLVALQIGLLVSNFFTRFMFNVDDSCVYSVTRYRNLLFYFQYATYVVIAFISLVRAVCSISLRVRKDYFSVFLFVMAPIVCGILQEYSPFVPYYSIGYLLGSCIIFSFVINRTSRERLVSQRMAIIKGLAADYDLVCYVNALTNVVSDFQVGPRFSEIRKSVDVSLPTNRQLDEFLRKIILPEDFENFLADVNRDRAVYIMERQVSYTVKFRIFLDGSVAYYELKLSRDAERDGGFVLGMRNIDFDTRREMENEELRRNLKEANLIANKDPLTGVGSASAFRRKVAEIDRQIDCGVAPEFAVVECDLNNLKHVNDTCGHEAGNVYIRENCAVFCRVFKHSPVFRIGGDEFVMFLQGSDFDNRDTLFASLRSGIGETCTTAGEIASVPGISFAAGMAVFNPKIDRSFADVLKRSDTFMYMDKKQMKQL